MRKPSQRRFSDEVDTDTPQVPPPPELLAFFILPLLVLIIWALLAPT